MGSQTAAGSAPKGKVHLCRSFRFPVLHKVYRAQLRMHTYIVGYTSVCRTMAFRTSIRGTQLSCWVIDETQKCLLHWNSICLVTHSRPFSFVCSRFAMYVCISCRYATIYILLNLSFIVTYLS